MSDNVNHPSHYADGCGFECIEMMESIATPEELKAHCILTAMKYMWRWQQKNGEEDLRKCKWYYEKAQSINGGVSEAMQRLRHVILEKLEDYQEANMRLFSEYMRLASLDGDFDEEESDE